MFMFSIRVSFDANMVTISSTTGRKRDSSDSRVFNVFHPVQVVNYGAFLSSLTSHLRLFNTPTSRKER